MKTYGQFCPVAKAAELFCARWTPLIIRDLAFGATRFGELQKGIPLASPTLLARRLRELEAEGVVARRRTRSGRRWTYHLTPAGEELVPLMMALGTWGRRWSRRELEAHEADVGLLVWALERGAHPESFGGGRTVVELQLTDQPSSRRRWWFVNEDGRCELCLHDPGFEVDLYLVTTLGDMIRIWRGDLSLTAALERGRLVAHGAAPARRALRRWLGISPLAHVRSRRDDAAIGAHAKP